MTDTLDFARARYQAGGLLPRVREALERIAPEPAPLTVEQLGALDHFHTRGLAATRALAELAELTPGMTVLDLGSGLGGPARLLAAKYGAEVTGVDLSESFVETATYLSQRCGLQASTRFLVGDACEPPIGDTRFDRVTLQHVAMNIADRQALYGAIRKALKPDGLLVTYDIVKRDGEAIYPTPWAKTAEASFLLTADETREALRTAGLDPVVLRDETQASLEWFATMQTGGPPQVPNLVVMLGPDFPAMTGNLGRNLRENHVGVLTAVARVV